jgi:hypothetical protein
MANKVDWSTTASEIEGWSTFDQITLFKNFDSGISGRSWRWKCSGKGAEAKNCTEDVAELHFDELKAV